jgi:hypothetical protein
MGIGFRLLDHEPSRTTRTPEVGLTTESTETTRNWAGQDASSRYSQAWGTQGIVDPHAAAHPHTIK